MAGGDAGMFMNGSESYIICPTCKGKGYCEENYLLKNKNADSKNNISNGMRVPRISTPKRGSTPTLKPMIVKDKLESKIPILPSKMSPSYSLKSNYNSSTSILKPGSRGNMSETSEMVADLIGHEEVENPAEFTKIVKAQLVSKEWSDRVLGMQNAVHLSRVDPEAAVEIGREVCRTILDELNSLRSRCVRVACQAAREIFQLGGEFVFRPVFDEIVNVLMGRAADSKRVIREDADDALMAIASYCPIQHVARAFTKGPKHKHQLVRKCALRVFRLLVNRIGVSTLVKNSHYRELRNTLLQAGCTLLADPISEIRNTAKQIMTPIAQTPEFDMVIQELDAKYYKKVECVLNSLKYIVEEKK